MESIALETEQAVAVETEDTLVELTLLELALVGGGETFVQIA